MPYAITLTNGRLFATVADGTLNQQSTMTLIGKDFAGYGQFVDQNFVRALENGASNTAPTTALTGQLWFDLTNYALRIANVGNIPNGALYTGANIQWRTAAPSYLGGANAPFQGSASKGDLWVFRNEPANVAQLRIYTGDPTSNTGGQGWAAVGPLNANDTVNVNVINATEGDFTTPLGTGSLSTDLLYIDNGNVTGTLNIGRDATGQPFPNASVDARDTLGFFGNLNGDQPYITSLGNSDPTVTNPLTTIFVGTGAARTTINSAGIITPSVTSNGTGSFATLVANTATFTTLNATTISGRFAAGDPSRYQPNVLGLGIQEQSFYANGTAIPGVGLTVSQGILPRAANGSNATINIGSNTFGGYFGNVYANVFYGQLAGGFAPGFIITTDFNIPNNDANIGNISVPSKNGNIVIGDGNSDGIGSGNIRIYGATGDILTRGSIGFDVTAPFSGDTYDFGFTPSRVGSDNFLTLGPDVTLTIQRNLVLEGNLTVEGNYIISNTSVVTTEDKTITVSDNVVGANVFNLNGSGVEAGNITVIGANAATFLYYNNSTPPIGVDPLRWQTNKSLYVTAGGQSGNIFADGYILARGPAGFQSLANTSSNIAGNIGIANLFVNGTGGVISGTVASATTAPSAPNNYAMLDGTNGTVGYARGQWLSGVFYPTAVTATALTSPVRDGSGDIYANEFRGIASQARYADLAEMYVTDTTYAPGTVVSVGGEAEVTICREGDHPLGVISTNPAFLMNKDLDNGQPVALRGRVPVRFTGVCHKGDKIGPSSVPGVATRNSTNPVAIALHTAYADAGTETVVEAVIL